MSDRILSLCDAHMIHFLNFKSSIKNAALLFVIIHKRLWDAFTFFPYHIWTDKPGLYGRADKTTNSYFRHLLHLLKESGPTGMSQVAVKGHSSGTNCPLGGFLIWWSQASGPVSTGTDNRLQQSRKALFILYLISKVSARW